MIIEVDNKEVIPLAEFELNWRWDNTHSPEITEAEKAQIEPVNEVESKRLNKIIDFFEKEDNLIKSFTQTDWISASSENDEKIEQFRSKLISIIEHWDEGIIVTWNRTTTLKTSKEIFLKYWDDFCYPISDDVTIISEKTNWLMFYNHIGVAKIWTKVKTNPQQNL